MTPKNHRRKMLAPPPAEFSTDFTAASRKRVGGAADGSTRKYCRVGPKTRFMSWSGAILHQNQTW